MILAVTFYAWLFGFVFAPAIGAVAAMAPVCHIAHVYTLPTLQLRTSNGIVINIARKRLDAIEYDTPLFIADNANHVDCYIVRR